MRENILVERVAIHGYRALRTVRFSLQGLNIVTGPNGSGKSALYRALRLLAEVAQGRIIQSLAAEGGLTSTLWAGPETITASMRNGIHPVQGTVRDKSVSLKLGFSTADFGYAIDLGFPPPIPPTRFWADPVVKVESFWYGPVLTRGKEAISRRGPAVMARGAHGSWRTLTGALSTLESMVAAYGDPRETPELVMMRDRLRGWRFYDHLRTDPDAPARRQQFGTYTPVLSADGADFAAAIQTILEIGDETLLAETIDDAFPGSAIEVSETCGYFEVLMRQPGLLRPLRATELSDGTLRYLLLTAALLTPRPPELMILNEPETSLHPDLIPALGRLVARAAGASQIVVVTHSSKLAEAIKAAGDAKEIALEKRCGETIIVDEEFVKWEWPKR